MNRQDLNKINLPENPGVYYFKDEIGNILYIGRATSLKDRVSSYFSDDLIKTRGPLLVDMVMKAKNISYKETDSVLEAIILESNEIKKYTPYYNSKEKDNRSYNYVIITDEDFPRIIIVRGRTLDKLDEKELKYKIKYRFGPYPQGGLLRDALKIIRKIFPYRDEKSNIKHQESFYKSIGLSPKFDNYNSREEYNKTIRNIALFFQGKKKQLIKLLNKEMLDYAKIENFEKAGEIRNTISALNHIYDISLVKKENIVAEDGYRIEAYDIAHLSGKNVVGVMTVIIDGEARKSEYRKFKITKEANNDTEALKEMLERRIQHSEWNTPNLIVIDGGINQMNVARSIIKDIPLVSVVKDQNHRPSHFLGNEEIINKYKKEILIANAEAHRFAIAYHKNLRNRKFII